MTSFAAIWGKFLVQKLMAVAVAVAVIVIQIILWYA